VQETGFTDPVFSSTSILCITAIWPAGPPKLSAATRTHTSNASRKDTRAVHMPVFAERKYRV
jgi:hypothetical protein